MAIIIPRFYLFYHHWLRLTTEIWKIRNARRKKKLVCEVKLYKVYCRHLWLLFLSIFLSLYVDTIPNVTILFLILRQWVVTRSLRSDRCLIPRAITAITVGLQDSSNFDSFVLLSHGIHWFGITTKYLILLTPSITMY